MPAVCHHPAYLKDMFGTYQVGPFTDRLITALEHGRRDRAVADQRPLYDRASPSRSADKPKPTTTPSKPSNPLLAGLLAAGLIGIAGAACDSSHHEKTQGETALLSPSPYHACIEIVLCLPGSSP